MTKEINTKRNRDLVTLAASSVLLSSSYFNDSQCHNTFLYGNMSQTVQLLKTMFLFPLVLLLEFPSQSILVVLPWSFTDTIKEHS